MNVVDVLPLIARLKRKPDSHKGDYGKVLIIGGADGMVGAPLLTGQAALHSGAGWVVIGFLSPNAPVVMQVQPEMMLRHIETLNFAEIGPDVIAIGPGMGTSEQAKDVLAQVLLMDVPLVIDADALNLLAADDALMGLLRARKAPSVLTPHPIRPYKLTELPALMP